MSWRGQELEERGHRETDGDKKMQNERGMPRGEQTQAEGMEAGRTDRQKQNRVRERKMGHARRRSTCWTADDTPTRAVSFESSSSAELKAQCCSISLPVPGLRHVTLDAEELLMVISELLPLKSGGSNPAELPVLSGRLIFPTQRGGERRAALR